MTQDMLEQVARTGFTVLFNDMIGAAGCFI